MFGIKKHYVFLYVRVFHLSTTFISKSDCNFHHFSYEVTFPYYIIIGYEGIYGNEHVLFAIDLNNL